MTEANGRRVCPLCGAQFLCEYEAGIDPCWCSRDFPGALPLPDGARACLCPRCLAEAIRRAAEKRQSSLT